MFAVADVNVIANEMQKRFVFDKVTGTKKCIAVSARIVLLDERESIRMLASRSREQLARSGADDDTNFFGTSIHTFFENQFESRFRLALLVDKTLERERLLVGSRGCDHSTSDTHGLLSGLRNNWNQDSF